ncbi:transcription factor S [Candidatus Woesearchaeota archaeon]|nr:transcription factor S [Candidatus Woesearchaeota archaeon]
MFCPKCGSMLLPKKDNGKKVMACSCGYKSSDTDSARITEKRKDDGRGLEIIDRQPDTYPKVEAKCEKCGHDKAFFSTQQTRAGDEPETKFFKCEKCGHIWRDYN